MNFVIQEKIMGKKSKKDVCKEMYGGTGPFADLPLGHHLLRLALVRGQPIEFDFIMASEDLIQRVLAADAEARLEAKGREQTGRKDD
jgi:hypothetical protein